MFVYFPHPSAVQRPGLYKAGFWVCVGGFALLPLFAVYLLTAPDVQPYLTIFEKGVFHVILLAAAFACFLRAAGTKQDRLIWIAFGFGSLMEALGVMYTAWVLSLDNTPPYPSPADLFYLLVYPGWYVGLVLMTLKHVTDRRFSMWLNGLIAGLACAAFAGALIFDRIVDTGGQNTTAVVTTLAYPVADTMLLALLVTTIAFNGWRPGLQLGLIGAGLAIFYAGDIIFALQTAAGTFHVARPLDLTWPTGMLLIAAAAFARVKPTRKFAHEVWWMLVPSVVFSGLAIGILVYGGVLAHVNKAAYWLAIGAVGVTVIQFALAQIENARLLAQSRDDAVTDHLTGLANRRQLFADLTEVCATAEPSDPSWFLMLDMNGFKSYNDRFGHVAGDGLLRRLGARLEESLAPLGCTVYRFGGDEFCALGKSSIADLDQATAAARDALTVGGEGFQTSAAHGSSMAPDDAVEPDDLIRVADQRMYELKHGEGPIDERHLETVIRVVQRYAPIVDSHRQELLPLIREAAVQIGITGIDAERVLTAFEVRDIGYYAIPNAMLQKTGPLDDTQWNLMRTHPIVGERLLALSPSLRAAGELVRASHERHDGGGYPDGLAGEEIMPGSRVLALAAAFDAMISHRPYRATRSVEQALVEIERNAGTQFEPVAAAAFCDAVKHSRFERFDRPHQPLDPIDSGV